MAYDDIERAFTGEGEWTSDQGLAAASEALIALIHRRSGRVIAHDSQVPSGEVSIDASFGSRLALRLFGLVMRAGRTRLPILLHARLRRASENTTQVRVMLRSDEGRYLFRLAELKWAYEKAFSRLLADLKAATTKPGPAP